MKTVFYYHPIFLEHETGPHPEQPKRLEKILSLLKQNKGEEFAPTAPGKADMGCVLAVHQQEYIESVDELCAEGGGFLDGDTPACARSFEAAMHAAGAVVEAADALAQSKAGAAFALVRPPGHHARPASGMGFCLINNVAVGAAHLLKKHDMERVLIVDFDVHHGNGTQEIFYEDPAVFFLSMHRYPFYPGTGGEDEVGKGDGRGKTLNVPVLYDTPPEKIMSSFRSALERAAAEHKPGMILVSAGFDAYAGDPIAGLGLQPEHYLKIGEAIRAVADVQCEGKVLSTLEGGYSLTGLPLCLDAYVDGIEGDRKG